MSNHKILTIDNLSLQEFDSEAELIPLLTPEDEEEMNNEELPVSLPILPLRNTVLFPGVVIPISAGRDKSIKLINDANAGGKIIGVVSQSNEEDEDPSKDDIRGNFIIKKTGIEGFMEAVNRIYAMNETDYQKMRDKCSKHVKKKFTAKRMAEDYYRLYKSVIKNHIL